LYKKLKLISELTNLILEKSGDTDLDRKARLNEIGTKSVMNINTFYCNNAG